MKIEDAFRYVAQRRSNPFQEFLLFHIDLRELFSFLSIRRRGFNYFIYFSFSYYIREE